MPELVIETGRIETQYWRDVWRYRELFLFFTWRDLLVRYKQTVVGVSWSLIRPLLMMIVLTVVFGKLGKMPAAGVPYPLLVFCGMLPWQFFATAITECGNSLVMNAGMISKIYFPRLVITVSSVMTTLIDFLVSAVFLAALMIYFHFPVHATLLILPFYVVLMLGVSLGVGLWISALMVEYRDFRFIVPFVVQFGLYISPVGFQTAIIPERYRLLYSLNPMVGIIDGFRWCILGGATPLYWQGVAMSTIEVVLFVFSGIWYFRMTERTFADVI